MEAIIDIQPWEVFKIYRSRKDNSIQYYDDLSDIHLSNTQKNWVCMGLDGKLEDDVNWNNLEIKYNENSITSNLNTFCNMFSINTINFRNLFYRNYKKNKFSHEKAGAPRKINNSQMTLIKNNIRDRRYKPNEEELNNMLKHGQEETARSYGRSRVQLALIIPLSATAKKIYIDEYGLNGKKGQVTNEARQTALEDKRCVAHWVAVYMAIGGNLPPYCKWNSDQSMVKIEAAGNNHKVYFSSEEEASAHDNMERLVIRTVAQV
jgi:hypothetical protein